MPSSSIATPQSGNSWVDTVSFIALWLSNRLGEPLQKYAECSWNSKPQKLTQTAGKGFLRYTVKRSHTGLETNGYLWTSSSIISASLYETDCVTACLGKKMSKHVKNSRRQTKFRGAHGAWSQSYRRKEQGMISTYKTSMTLDESPANLCSWK